MFFFCPPQVSKAENNIVQKKLHLLTFWNIDAENRLKMELSFLVVHLFFINVIIIGFQRIALKMKAGIKS